MTNKHNLSAILASCLMWYGLLATTACTEQAENTIGQSDTPIQFSVNMATQAHSATTRVTTDAFEPQDQIGLFATLSPAKLSEERYIDNLLLETADGTQFTPEQVVYYPIGDVTLDFTAYYPYQTGGLSSGNSILSISVFFWGKAGATANTARSPVINIFLRFIIICCCR